jgi:hypothetical protein
MIDILAQRRNRKGNMDIDFVEMLGGGDRRSIGRSEEAVSLVLEHPELFGNLLGAIQSPDPVVRMRAADAAEKASAVQPELLQPFKTLFLGALADIPQQEVRWHVAQMLPRLKLTPAERQSALAILQNYLSDRSRIVVVFSLQAMADLAQQDPSLRPGVLATIESLQETGSPAIRSRATQLYRRLTKAK